MQAALTTRLPFILPGFSRTTVSGFENAPEGSGAFVSVHCPSNVTFPVHYFDGLRRFCLFLWIDPLCPVEASLRYLRVPTCPVVAHGSCLAFSFCCYVSMFLEFLVIFVFCCLFSAPAHETCFEFEFVACHRDVPFRGTYRSSFSTTLRCSAHPAENSFENLT